MISLSEEEINQITMLAQERGHATPEEYLRALIQADIEQHDDEYDIRASIERGLRQALSGDVLSEEEFWKAVSDDE